MSKKIYIITGPAGVGKSTISKALARKLSKSAYINGDMISHMAVAGRENPWESKDSHELILKNINDLTSNFLTTGYDVVIDWIFLWGNIKKYMLNWINEGIEVHYVILWSKESINKLRDEKRPLDIQMGKRVQVLRNEFLNSKADSRFYLDNTNDYIDDVLSLIVNDNRFLISRRDL